MRSEVSYYLDTCAVRQLSPYLKDLAPVAYTSMWTLMELVSGISSEYEFQLRHRVLSNVINSKMHILWKTPIEIIASAFSNIIYEEKLHRDLKPLVEMIVQTPDYQSFLDKQKKLDKGIEYFLSLDAMMNVAHKSNAGEEIKKFNEFRKAGIQIVSEVNAGLVALKDFIVRSINEKAPVGAKLVSPKDLQYNGSIDVFLFALREILTKIVLESQIPKDNDWIDLHQTLYIGNSTGKLKLVTDDRLIKNILTAYKSECYASITNLRNLIL